MHHQGISGTSTDIYELISRIGNVTRMLRSSLRELGHDITIAELANSIPDARSRLQYVVDLTAQASGKTLTYIELTQPLQEQLSQQASQLLSQWQQHNEAASIDETMALARATHDWLGSVPTRTEASKSWLREIMMAQDFPDTTARIIVRMMALLENIEKEFLNVLLENVPREGRATIKQASADPTAPQAAEQDIDELLNSLGL
ncbi:MULTISPECIES: protein phosphatase CheZ [Kosakonia]|uniref:protein phosphatase CheZ n=1 Tax=Kosakonia TaxID=1330547 RepID=UPI0005F08000|nr:MULTISPECIES: protein phosphatase CheZ [Kosakonia]MCZ3382541.1 protein phosphatase CheZ [Kosakonia sp. SOY2]RCX06267.1 chemotaxis protein CheZ [Kosakonia sp. AG348]